MYILICLFEEPGKEDQGAFCLLSLILTICPEVRITLIARGIQASQLIVHCLSVVHKKKGLVRSKNIKKIYCFKYICINTFASRHVRMWTFQRRKAPALEIWTHWMWENTRTLQAWPTEGATYVAIFGYQYIYQNQKQDSSSISAADLHNSSDWLWYKRQREICNDNFNHWNARKDVCRTILYIHSAEYWVRFIIP